MNWRAAERVRHRKERRKVADGNLLRKVLGIAAKPRTHKIFCCNRREKDSRMEQTTLITMPYSTSAHEMHRLTEESIKKINEQQLKHIFDQIHGRAMIGYFNLSLWEPLSSENKKFLEINGYKIWEGPSACCTYKGQPATLTTISWEEGKEND